GVRRCPALSSAAFCPALSLVRDLPGRGAVFDSSAELPRFQLVVAAEASIGAPASAGSFRVGKLSGRPRVTRMLVSPVFARFLRDAASGDRVASFWATRSGAGSSVVALLLRSFASLLAS